MRADRLVAILLMLQTKGQVTAAEVAAELEISERTARRGPRFAGRGRAAGLLDAGSQRRLALAGDGRTDLTGLTSARRRRCSCWPVHGDDTRAARRRCASWFAPSRAVP